MRLLADILPTVSGNDLLLFGALFAVWQRLEHRLTRLETRIFGIDKKK